eukprot:scaffold6995_cov66-Attheya_sp.AAC.1
MDHWIRVFGGFRGLGVVGGDLMGVVRLVVVCLACLVVGRNVQMSWSGGSERMTMVSHAAVRGSREDGTSPVAPRVPKSTNDNFDSLVRVDVANEIVCHQLSSKNIFNHRDPTDYYGCSRSSKSSRSMEL